MVSHDICLCPFSTVQIILSNTNVSVHAFISKISHMITGLKRNHPFYSRWWNLHSSFIDVKKIVPEFIFYICTIFLEIKPIKCMSEYLLDHRRKVLMTKHSLIHYRNSKSFVEHNGNHAKQTEWSPNTTSHFLIPLSLKR